MGHQLLNLNVPPIEDSVGCYVDLEKDSKPVCCVKLPNPPFRVPSTWSISDIKKPSAFPLADLPRFSLSPAPKNSQHEKEWIAFLHFLQDYNKVAAVRSTVCDFYILPPDEARDFSYALVQYQVKKGYHEFSDQAPGPSGRTLVDSCNPKNVCSDVVQKNSSLGLRQPRSLPESSGVLSKKPGYLLGERSNTSRSFHHQSTHSLREESGDNSEAIVKKGGSSLRVSSTHLQNSSTHLQNYPNVSFPEAGGKLYTCQSGEDAHLEQKDGCHQKISVQTHPSYLRTLSQTHSGWIFGAIAELIDNSRDAKATRLYISIESLYLPKEGRNVPVLSVIDDGHGMSHLDTVRMLAFGHEQPEGDDPDHIGRFGIGFKSGAMRLGKDAIVFTQSSNSRSVALLSQSFNEGKDNVEIPIVSYCRHGNYMEVDTSIQSKAIANSHLEAIRKYSPFNEYGIGDKFKEMGTGTGTQIHIWNLDRWGSKYSLEWVEGDPHRQGDILIRSRRVRSRSGQITQKVPLDYSLQSYLEVIFLDPRMKIYVQGSLVKSRPLAKSLNKTVVKQDQILGKCVELTLGRSQKEWDQMNRGIFLYWHGRLIEAYKRVGSMVYNPDVGQGVIGVIDVTDIMNDKNGSLLVHSNKQAFEDSEEYAELEKWLGNKSDEYWDANYDAIELQKVDADYKPDHEWVQCSKCRKWRTLPSGFNSDRLPAEWFCYMAPFKRNCGTPEEQLGLGVITVATKRSGLDPKRSSMQVNDTNLESGHDEDNSTQTVEKVGADLPVLKRLRRCATRSCKRA